MALRLDPEPTFLLRRDPQATIEFKVGLGQHGLRPAGQKRVLIIGSDEGQQFGCIDRSAQITQLTPLRAQEIDLPVGIGREDKLRQPAGQVLPVISTVRQALQTTGQRGDRHPTEQQALEFAKLVKLGIDPAQETAPVGQSHLTLLSASGAFRLRDLVEDRIVGLVNLDLGQPTANVGGANLHEFAATGGVGLNAQLSIQIQPLHARSLQGPQQYPVTRCGPTLICIDTAGDGWLWVHC